MNHKLVVASIPRARRDANRKPRRWRARQLRIVEPRRVALDTRAFAREQVRHETLTLADIGKRITIRWIEHTGADPQLATRGDCRRYGKSGGNLARHLVVVGVVVVLWFVGVA